jgi:hypothetical protein
MRSEAPLDVLPAASHNIERIVFQLGHVVRTELRRYATMGQIDGESQARPNRFLIWPRFPIPSPHRPDTQQR